MEVKEKVTNIMLDHIVSSTGLDESFDSVRNTVWMESQPRGWLSINTALTLLILFQPRGWNQLEPRKDAFTSTKRRH